MPRDLDDQQQAPVPAPVLVSRLLASLDTCAHLVATGDEVARRELAYRASQAAIGFLDAALGGRLTREHLERRLPAHLQAATDVARLVRSVSQAVAVWWGANQARLPAEVDTYDGLQPLAVVLERTVERVANRERQLRADTLAPGGTQ